MTETSPGESRPVALVTGASAGIGEQFARILAAKGYDLVIVARGAERLAFLADELKRSFGTASEVVVADLASEGGIRSVETRITDGGAVELVINNAGFGWRGRFVDQTADEIAEMVHVNVLALSVLSRAALAVMTARRSGGLLNVSSMAGFVPGPSGSLYHATKAFVTLLTEALHEEARPFGVHVSALCPGVTPSGFQARSGSQHEHLPHFAMTDAALVAAAGLAALQKNQTVCVPGGFYRVLAGVIDVAPRAVVRKAAGRVVEKL